MRVFILKNKIRHYGILLIIALLVEIFICNFSSWKTLGQKEIILTENQSTDSKGTFVVVSDLEGNNNCSITDKKRGIEVKNIMVDLDIERYDRANITVSITDEGNQYSYDLPVYEMVPQVKSSGYKNIYPYGDVTSIKIKVEVPEGTEANIHKIALNVQKPFEVKTIRMAIIYGVILLFYTIWRAEKDTLSPCCRKSKWQKLFIIGMVSLFCLIGMLLSISNPACKKNIWPHHGQYQELAHVLVNGEVALKELPDERLLQKENPYDTAALGIENIYYKMDYAFYEGRYYAYFGIIPEILLYLPFYLLLGKDLPNFIAVFIFYSGFVMGVFGLVWELVHRYGRKVPFIFYILLSIAIAGAANYIILVARPDIYNVAVMAGNCFLALGCYLLIKGLQKENRKCFWYFLGALSFSFVAGCRPQMLLYAFFLIPLFWPEIKGRKLFSKKSLKDTIAIVAPVFLVAIVVCWYNIARFGSPVDFGATYSLTTNDMNHRGFNLARTLSGLFSFYVQPAVLSTTFPYISSVILEGNYMGKNITEFFYGGIVFMFPLSLVLTYFFIDKKAGQLREWRKSILLLLFVSLVVTIFDINAAGVIIRYMSDMAFGVMIATALVWIRLLSDCAEEKIKCLSCESKKQKENEKKGEDYWKGGSNCIAYRTFLILFIFGWILCFFAVISKEGSINLYDYHPNLYYRIASYFQL